MTETLLMEMVALLGAKLSLALLALVAHRQLQIHAQKYVEMEWTEEYFNVMMEANKMEMVAIRIVLLNGVGSVIQKLISFHLNALKLVHL